LSEASGYKIFNRQDAKSAKKYKTGKNLNVFNLEAENDLFKTKQNGYYCSLT